MFKKISLISCLLAFSFNIFADEPKWLELDKNEEFTIYMNPAYWNVTDQYSKIVEVWTKNVVHTDLSKDGLAIDDYALYQYSIKCSERKIGIMSAALYKKTGKLIESETVPRITYEPIFPNSLGDVMSGVVCDIEFKEE